MTPCSTPRRLRRLRLSMLLFVTSIASTGLAQEGDKVGPTDTLEVQKIVLFNAGIGYFEHHGEANGDASISLPFASEDVDDLLKTLVMQDADGGRFWVDYDAAQSADGKSGIQLSNAPTFGELLQQLRGEEVEAEDPAMRGVIFGLELKSSLTSSGEAIEEEYLNLLTADGIKSVPLKSFSAIKFKDKELQHQLAKALASVAATRRDGKRTIRFRFSGEGRRHVQLGYLRQTPVWKTTHRLVLGDKPQIQSWAIVENTGETDWKRVQLSLVGGNPISFDMALEPPRFVQRPVAELPFSGIPMPRIHEGASAIAGMGMGGGGFGGGGGLGGMGGGGLGGKRPFVTSVIPVVPGGGSMGGGGGGGDSPFSSSLSLRVKQSQTVASSGAIGQFYQYVLKEPVELDAGRSAMLPIHVSNVKAERLSVYTPDLNDDQLLHAVLVNNNTESHWAAGPLTIYEDNVYAGEAQMTHCPPGAQRLASYAADLEIEAEHDIDMPKSVEKGMKITKGELITTVERSREQHYRFVSLSDKGKTVLIEHMRPDLEGDWEIVADKKLDELRLETTESHIRFKAPVPAKKAYVLTIREKRLDSYPELLSEIPSGRLEKLLEKPYFAATEKTLLKTIIRLRAEVESVATRLMSISAELATLEKDQSRIRSNMNELDRNSELYKQYVTKLTGHETEFQKLREEHAASLATQKKLQAELDQLAPPADPAPKSDAAPDPFAPQP